MILFISLRLKMPSELPVNIDGFLNIIGFINLSPFKFNPFFHLERYGLWSTPV